MTEFAPEIVPVNIEDELRQSYLDYAMSVIVGRALPDVRDGLKPVHRRALFAMHELGNDWNKAYKKSARVVGDVIGKYHPHGDTAVYDTIVRMAQPFSLRYLLVDGQGNFGSVDGDAPAAMRYTEVRMTRLAHDLLADLEKDTVDWAPNYDGSEMIPSVLPTRIPNLLINGSSGIAVGMATNIPPHNLTEVINACLAYVDDNSITVEGLMQYVTGPDFPTGAIINGRSGIIEAYKTGRGRIHIRARHHVETDNKTGRHTIVFTEIPYQLNKARVIEKIAELVKEKKLEGISELRDESDKDGMRIVIELKRNEVPDVVVNNLFAHTPLESSFSFNMLALQDGQPKLLNLRDLISSFIRHRQEVVTRRTVYELRKARERGHIVEGLAVALANIDEVIELIKTSANGAQAKERLLDKVWKEGGVLALLERAGDKNACRPEGLPEYLGLLENGYKLSADQAQAILDLRLHRLTGLEQDKLMAEYEELLGKISELLAILADAKLLMDVIRHELKLVLDTYGDARKTEIIASRLDLSIEDLITDEQVVLTISHTGYAKIQPLSDYRAQKRGGRGKSATSMKDEDYVEHLLVASTHDTVLCFTSLGKVYWIKVYDLPQAGRGAKGKPLVNLLQLVDDEKVTAILPLREYAEGQFVFMATADGTVKRVELSAFSRPRANGLIAIELDGDNELIGVAVTDGHQDIMLFSNLGKAIRFRESDVRSMGRTAMGVRGMRLPDGGRIVSMVAVPYSADGEPVLVPADEDALTEHLDDAEVTLDTHDEDLSDENEDLVLDEHQAQVLIACANGYGKRTPINKFTLRKRGGQGILAIQTNERNGELVSAVVVAERSDILLISDLGTLVRTRVGEVSVQSRNAQGVTLIRMSDDEQLVGVVCLEVPDEEEVLAENAEATSDEAVVGDLSSIQDAEDANTDPIEAE
ncbi:DNA gyrase subunit A [Agitococcus lubricus]|uniref:DNA gyrase subunit A n=1 Tax=Agitococcus lubricus TaxID=1077255 RepID=A0A2T5IZ00_9GAMM|nr:DNA gyrase subunit A [Agitococcus lubricus]PTQ89237.1 DNA gyrase subunit A [Agitococcus lubricus]